MQSALKTKPIAVNRTHDPQLVRDILAQLLDTLAEDYESVDELTIDCKKDCWLDIDGMGLFHLHADNSTTTYIHAQVLKPYRYLSEEIGYAVWNWVLDNTEYQKFITVVPVIYPHVKAYTEKMGMIEEGLNRKSACKNGEIIDQWLMGITRKEVEDFLCPV